MEKKKEKKKKEKKETKKARVRSIPIGSDKNLQHKFLD